MARAEAAGPAAPAAGAAREARADVHFAEEEFGWRTRRRSSPRRRKVPPRPHPTCPFGRQECDAFRPHVQGAVAAAERDARVMDVMRG